MAIETKMTASELADAAVGMFLEYRDVHGRSEDQARLEAASEIRQGVDAEQELRAAGEIPPLPAAYRLAVRDPENANVPFHYDQPCLEAARTAWRLLQDYARDGVTSWIEERAPNGWRTAASD
jgi:hypothetical protein